MKMLAKGRVVEVIEKSYGMTSAKIRIEDIEGDFVVGDRPPGFEFWIFTGRSDTERLMQAMRDSKAVRMEVEL